jgi:hypothetical protein
MDLTERGAQEPFEQIEVFFPFTIPRVAIDL